MKIRDAVLQEKEIHAAADHLNRLIQQASCEGFKCKIDYQSFAHVSGLVFDVVQVECFIVPSKLESD